MNNVDLAAALFAALASGDAEAVRSLCAPNLQASQNRGPNMSVDALLEFTQAVLAVVPDFHYEKARRVATDTGFVEEHSVRGTLPDGSALRLAACVVADVENGRITHLREYLDGAAARGLIKALSNAKPV